jgi:hypothetical protein
MPLISYISNGTTRIDLTKMDCDHVDPIAMINAYEKELKDLGEGHEARKAELEQLIANIQYVLRMR